MSANKANQKSSKNEPGIAAYDYDSIPAGYYDVIFKRNQGIQSAWHQQKFQFLADLIPPSEKHLDVGCGPGTFLGNFSRAQLSVGVDIASDQIIYAKNNYENEHVTFLHIRSDTLPFPDDYFDVVSMVEVIEHLDRSDLKKIMNEVKRVLKPGGRLVLSTPNYQSLWPVIEWLVNKIAKISYDEQHITKFSPKSLNNFIRDLGFSIVNSGSYLFSGPFMAPINMDISNRVARFEEKLANNNFFLLLYVVAQKAN